MTFTFPVRFSTSFVIPLVTHTTTDRHASPALPFELFRQNARTVHFTRLLCSVRRSILSPFHSHTFSPCCLLLLLLQVFFCLYHLRKCRFSGKTASSYSDFFSLFSAAFLAVPQVSLFVSPFFNLLSLSVILTDRGVYVTKKATPIIWPLHTAMGETGRLGRSVDCPYVRV
jgi:hypothetical protein